MAYIDSKGNVVEKKPSIFDFLFSFFGAVILFFQSLFGLDSSSADTNQKRDHLRRNGGGGGGWPGSGGPGGPGRGYYGNGGPGGGGGGRRQIGRLPTASGMSCPPMAGGG